MAPSTESDCKDVFYHCIPILNAINSRELNGKLRHLASELYDEETSRLKQILGSDLTKESWIRRAQRMARHPDYDQDEGNTYICIRATGRCSGRHDEVVDLLATKLMSQAPETYPTRKTVISSDKSLSSKTFPDLFYKDGRLVERQPVEASCR